MPFKNKDKQKEYNKKYNKLWYVKNKQLKDKQNMKYYNSIFRGSIKCRYSVYRGSAKRKGLIFNIDIKSFENLIKSPCVYCGDISNGLDRVDNDLGYISENIVPCCSMCNYMKKNYDIEQFLEQCKKIVEFNS